MFKAFSDGLFGSLPVMRGAQELEVIERRARQRRFETPVLFVHGAFAGAWCWDEYFLPYFAAQGADVYALSLRGHGGSGGLHWLHTAGLDDYVTDLARTVQALERPPLLVGHSMGGMVIQKYLEKYCAPGAVLMASVPPSGLAMSSLRMLLGDPWLLMQLSLMQGWAPVDLGTAKRAVFSNDISDLEMLRYARYFQAESARAIWEMHIANLPRSWRVQRLPMLVLGAENDALFTASAVRETARVYGVEAEILPRIAHAMMLERRWQVPADRILDWMEVQGL